jgi:membrane protein insertase Oxa1/YidC/SpoIIIJ
MVVERSALFICFILNKLFFGNHASHSSISDALNPCPTLMKMFTVYTSLTLVVLMSRVIKIYSTSSKECDGIMSSLALQIKLFQFSSQFYDWLTGSYGVSISFVVIVERRVIFVLP